MNTQENTLKAVPNPEWDGALTITGAKTLKRYRELCESRDRLPLDKFDLFAAFTPSQLKDGYEGLVARGVIKDGDKVKSFGAGIYGTREGLDRFKAAVKAINEQISKECDPLEIYCEEFNNYECCLDWDGDQRAVQAVLRLFGLDRTKQALEGKRFLKCGTIEGIFASMND